ncbi:unnamed protein product [Prorocentrum cordatum]|uniref:Uncharacterized protein n=1 Tax=Prorocentrum cordatum TaxID=2364126 RepID=A0ABN9S1Z9_9DINO|nr:unnamed protein product [Polarella glacialis]
MLEARGPEDATTNSEGTLPVADSMQEAFYQVRVDAASTDLHRARERLVAAAAARVRRHSTVPADPQDPSQPWAKALAEDMAVELQRVHCAFSACTWRLEVVDELHEHVAEEHWDIALPIAEIVNPSGEEERLRVEAAYHEIVRARMGVEAYLGDYGSEPGNLALDLERAWENGEFDNWFVTIPTANGDVNMLCCPEDQECVNGCEGPGAVAVGAGLCDPSVYSVDEERSFILRVASAWLPRCDRLECPCGGHGAARALVRTSRADERAASADMDTVQYRLWELMDPDLVRVKCVMYLDLCAHLLQEHRAQLEDIAASLVCVSAEEEKSEELRYLSAYNEVVAWKVRQGAPLAALAIDRRCLRAYAEALGDESVCSLICMLCARKFPHVEGRRGNPITWQKVSPDSDGVFGLPGSFVRKHMSVDSYVGRCGQVGSDVHLRHYAEDFEDWQATIASGDGHMKVLCCPEDLRCSTESWHEGNEVCDRCEAPLCEECRTGMSGPRGEAAVPPAALANDMMTFYSPEELFAGNVTLLEMICASVCVTSMVCFTLEKRHRNERSFDMEAGNNTRRMAARGNATSFPMPWTDMLAQLTALEEGASKVRPPSVPRTGKELADIVSVILKSGGDDDAAASMAKFIHQAVVRRDVVVKLIEGAKKRGRRAYQHVCMEEVRKKAAELPDGEVPPEIMRLVPLDNELDNIQTQKAATPVPRPDGLQEAAEILETTKGNAVVLEKSSFDDGDINAQRVEALRSFVQRVSPECEHDGTRERTDHSESESEHEGTRAKRPREGGRETEPDFAPAKERGEARLLTEALERTWFTYVSANPKDVDAQITPEEISEGAKQIYRALAGKYQDVNGKKQKVMGDMTKVRYVPGLGRAAHRSLQRLTMCAWNYRWRRSCRKCLRGRSAGGETILQKTPKVIFVLFDEGLDDAGNVIPCKWTIPGLRTPGLHPVSPQRKDWFVDKGRPYPRLKVKRRQFPLAPAFGVTAHSAQGQTFKQGIIVDLRIGGGTSPLSSYVALTRVRRREDMLIFRPFDRAPYTQKERKGPGLLLQSLRGDPMDWDAIEKEFMPAGKCALCSAVKYKNQFALGQWSRDDGLRVCKLCLEGKKSIGTPWQCMECYLWKGQDAFHTSQHHSSKLTSRRCVDCPERRKCYVCEKRKYEDAFVDLQWEKAGNARCKGGMCRDCEEAKRHLKCSRCGEVTIAVLSSLPQSRQQGHHEHDSGCQAINRQVTRVAEGGDLGRELVLAPGLHGAADPAGAEKNAVAERCAGSALLRRRGNAGTHDVALATRRELCAAEASSVPVPGINLATSLHRVAKLAAAGGPGGIASAKELPELRELVDRVEQHVLNHSLRHDAKSALAPASEEMPVHSLSIVAWCCATLQIRNKQLFAAIYEMAAPRLSEFKSFEFSNLLWALAKMSLSPSELLRSMTAQLLRRRPGEFHVQCLSTIAWSLTTIKRRNLVVYDSLAKELAARAGEMKPQEVSNTLWAFAKAGCAKERLFEALGDVAVRTLASFKPQELSNTVWAFATAGLHHPALFDSVLSASAQKMHVLVPQNFANILWAYAKLGDVRQPGALSQLLQAAGRQLPRHKPQELSAVIWAASKVCPSDDAFFRAAFRCCVDGVREFSPNGLANLVRDLSAVEAAEPEALMALLGECGRQAGQFKTPALCSLLRGTCVALRGDKYAAISAEVAAHAERAGELLAARVGELQLGELEEVHSAMQGCPAELRGLRRAVDARLEQQLAAAAAAPRAGAAPAGKTTCSVGSASTSAEGSQAEEEWPAAEDLSGAEDSEERSPSERSARRQPPPARRGGQRRTPPASAPPGLGPDAGAPGQGWAGCGPAAAGAPAGTRALDASCLAEELACGALAAVDPAALAFLPLLGVGGSKVRLRCGLLDERVVLKRLPPQAASVPSAPLAHPNVLFPLAHISGGFGAPAFAAYPHCRHGSLGEWLAARRAAGRPVGAAQAARVLLGALAGVDALQGAWGHAAVKAMQPDEILIDADETPRVREPRLGGLVDGQALKWLSPEEASGALPHCPDAWPALAYRLGMVLFCAGTAEPADPHPGHRGEAVLQGLLAECGGGPPVRPDLGAFRAPRSCAGSSRAASASVACSHRPAARWRPPSPPWRAPRRGRRRWPTARSR